jgi:hypothetical protein
MKTHKTASSTLQNILFRFGLTHNLKIGVPVKGKDYTFISNHKWGLDPFNQGQIKTKK